MGTGTITARRESAPAGKIIGVLFDGAIFHLNLAITRMMKENSTANDEETAKIKSSGDRNIRRAQLIIAELRVHHTGIEQECETMNAELRTASQLRDLRRIKEVIQLLESRQIGSMLDEQM